MEQIDQLKVDTPEQIALEFPLAGIGSRFLGLAADTILQVIAYFLGVMGLVFIGPSLGIDHWFDWIPASIGPAVMVLFLFCIYWGYFALFEIYWNGQTPGKRISGIRVIHQSGRPANAYEVIGRNLLRAVDSLPGVYLVGVVTMILNRQNRRVGDFVAGTVVVHDKRTDEVKPDWSTTESQTIEGAKLAKVGPEVLILIETYLHRRLDLAPEVRESTSQQIAARVTAMAGLERPSGQSVDDFLEAIARQVRSTSHFR